MTHNVCSKNLDDILANKKAPARVPLGNAWLVRSGIYTTTYTLHNIHDSKSRGGFWVKNKQTAGVPLGDALLIRSEI